MKKIIICLAVAAFAVGSFTSCKKLKYECYSYSIDTSGSVITNIDSKDIRRFSSESDAAAYMSANNKACYKAQ